MNGSAEYCSSASLIVTIGERLQRCAQETVTAYKTSAGSGRNDSLVFGYSLAFSREYQPGGQVVFKPITTQDTIPCKDRSVNWLYDIHQLEFGQLKAVIEQMWQEFREHVARVKAFNREPEVARNQIIVLADTWDPDCSYLLLPVLYCLKEMADEANETEIAVILDISKFSNGVTNNNQESLMFRLVKQIEYRIDPNPKLIHDPLLGKLGYSDDLAFDGVHFFIVNNEKEGSLFAKSHQEIEDVIFSFLLGFVDPRLRDNLLEVSNPEYQVKNRTYFSSFGSVGMYVNPQLAIDYCKLRLSSEIIQKGFLAEQPPDRELIWQLSDDVISQMGDNAQWYQDLIRKPDFSVMKEGESGLSLAFSLPHIPFEPPYIDQTENVPFIADIDKSFEVIQDKLFGELNFLHSHTHLKTSSILASRRASINKILTQANLVPGYLSNIRFVLSFIKNELDKRLSEAKCINNDLIDESIVQSQFTEAKTNFKNVLKSFIPPPSWFQRIPEGGIKKIIRMVLKILQAKKYMDLDRARARVEKSLTNLVSNPYEKALAEFILDVSTQSTTLVEEFEQTLTKFEKNLIHLKEEFDQQLEIKKTQLEPVGSEPEFVYRPLTERVCEKLYLDYKPKDNLAAADLIFQQEWVARFINNQEDNLSAELLEFSASHFSGINDISLSRIIVDYAEAKVPGETFYKKLSNLTDRVLVLLNPELSAMGENAKVGCISSALISKAGEDFWPTFMSHQSKKWEQFTGISAHIASFVTVQHGFSYDSIEPLFSKGQTLWDALSDAEKQQYDIIPDKDKKPPRAKAELLHDGIWRITYNWHFTPSGSTKSYPFEASIEVDQTSYKKLLDRDRFVGQYHLYAEENSAEIDQLVQHFKRIQHQYKWDSFDQASNVLSFVQSFISYRYDKDTKYVEEYPRYPLETLWDRVGDCEDFAILSGSILSRLGFKVALLLYPKPVHLAFGVETAKTHKVEKLIKDPKYDVSYYYGEGTNKAWKLGEIPQDYQGVIPDFFRISESSWAVTPEAKETLPDLEKE